MLNPEVENDNGDEDSIPSLEPYSFMTLPRNSTNPFSDDESDIPSDEQDSNQSGSSSDNIETYRSMRTMLKEARKRCDRAGETLQQFRSICAQLYLQKVNGEDCTLSEEEKKLIFHQDKKNWETVCSATEISSPSRTPHSTDSPGTQTKWQEEENFLLNPSTRGRMLGYSERNPLHEKDLIKDTTDPGHEYGLEMISDNPRVRNCFKLHENILFSYLPTSQRDHINATNIRRSEGRDTETCKEDFDRERKPLHQVEEGNVPELPAAVSIPYEEGTRRWTFRDRGSSLFLETPKRTAEKGEDMMRNKEQNSGLKVSRNTEEPPPPPPPKQTQRSKRSG